MMLFTSALAKKLAGKGVAVIVVHPGGKIISLAPPPPIYRAEFLI